MPPFVLLAYIFVFRNPAFPPAWWHNFERKGGITSFCNLPFESKRSKPGPPALLKQFPRWGLLCFWILTGWKYLVWSWLTQKRVGVGMQTCLFFFWQVLGSYMLSLWTCGFTLSSLLAAAHALKRHQLWDADSTRSFLCLCFRLWRTTLHIHVCPKYKLFKKPSKYMQ